jgi:hypothetical protein
MIHTAVHGICVIHNFPAGNALDVTNESYAAAVLFE